MISKHFLLWMVLCRLLTAQEYTIPQVVLNAIQYNECLKVDGKCDPYVIRISYESDIAKAKKSNLKVHDHHIRCHTVEECTRTLKKLLAMKIDNVDLGPYQINYHWHNDRWGDREDYSAYFMFQTAESRTREILRNLIDAHGYSWQTLGRYNHFDPNNLKRNRLYFQKLYRYIYGPKAITGVSTHLALDVGRTKGK